MRLLDLRTLMLGVSALLLVVSALADGRELARHLLDGPSESASWAATVAMSSRAVTSSRRILREPGGAAGSRFQCNQRV
jgi:hypothetical protein